jgi:hypothetical protein
MRYREGDSVKRPPALCLSLLSGLAALVGCGDENPAIVVRLQPFSAALFAGVTTVRLEVTGTGMQPVQAEAVRTASAVRLPPIPFGRGRQIKVEGIDDQSLVVAHGQSDPFEVTASTPAEVTVAITRCDQKLYRDDDGDKFGTGDVHTGCQQTGWTAFGGDCDDKDPDAHPLQLKFFSRPRQGAGEYDFDCNNREDKQYQTVLDCATAAPCRGDGWVGSAPECGQSADWYTCTKIGAECVATKGPQKIQSCH